MKKLNVVLIAVAMSFTLCACGTEATGSMSITETGEQQTVKQNTGTEQTDTEENSEFRKSDHTSSAANAPENAYIHQKFLNLSRHRQKSHPIWSLTRY